MNSCDGVHNRSNLQEICFDVNCCAIPRSPPPSPPLPNHHRASLSADDDTQRRSNPFGSERVRDPPPNAPAVGSGGRRRFSVLRNEELFLSVRSVCRVVRSCESLRSERRRPCAAQRLHARAAPPVRRRRVSAHAQRRVRRTQTQPTGSRRAESAPGHFERRRSVGSMQENIAQRPTVRGWTPTDGRTVGSTRRNRTGRDGTTNGCI